MKCPKCETEFEGKVCPKCGYKANNGDNGLTDDQKEDSTQSKIENSASMQGPSTNQANIQTSKKLNQKTIFVIGLVIAFLLGLFTTSIIQKNSVPDNSSEIHELTTYKREQQKSSDDKHLLYLKDYKGLKGGQIGEWRSGECYDDYSYSYYHSMSLRIVFRAEDGTTITKHNCDNYIVKSQSVKPNTPIKLTFDKDSNGQEEDSQIDNSSLKEVDLEMVKLDPNN